MLDIEQQEMSERIKLKRKSLKYTQDQFAEIISISLSSYVKIENSFQKPSLDTLIKICKNLNVSLDYLVFGDDAQSATKINDQDLINALFNFTDKDKIKHTSEVLVKLAQLIDKN